MKKSLREYIYEKFISERGIADIMGGNSDNGNSDNGNSDNADSDSLIDNPEENIDNNTGDNPDNNGQDKKEDEFSISDIRFNIWQDFETKVQHLKSNKHYQKIEYKYIDDKNNIQIDFLLGYLPKEKTWALYAGKIGATGYDDKPYKKLKTTEFDDAVIYSLDIIKDYIQEVKDNPDEYSDYYIEEL